MNYLLALLAFIAFSLVVIIAFTLIAAIVILGGIFYLFAIPALYISCMADVLLSDTTPVQPASRDEVLRSGPDRVDGLVALPSYFYGPAFRDFRSILARGPVECDEYINAHWSRVSGKLISSPENLKAGWALVVFLGLRGAILAGGAAGAVATMAVVIVHGAATTAAIGLASVFSILLRWLDALTRLARKINMICPTCSGLVRPYPIYRCPNCYEVHHDIRPGALGVLTRICVCGQRLRTSLLTGTKEMVAACPHCTTPLPSKFGTVRETVIPFFGSNNVGKTRLLYYIIVAINQLVSTAEGTVEIDERTVQKLRPIGDDLEIIGGPSRTLPQIPDAHVLRIRIGDNERLLYLFDAAGEIYSETKSLEEIRYLSPAHTLIFVVDPLSSDYIWNQLSPEQQQSLLATRSIAEEIEIAYEATSEHMQRTRQRHRFRMRRYQPGLAFVMSKADLIGTSTLPAPAEHQIRAMVCDAEGLDKGNIARRAEQSFNPVKYFQTAAKVDEAGKPDSSVVALARWLLRREGLVGDATAKDE